MADTPPLNLVYIALAHEDPTILISPDEKRVEVNLAAIARLIANPPLMLQMRKADPMTEER